MGSALATEQYQTVLEAVLELLKKVHNVSMWKYFFNYLFQKAER
jgi:hypothetical protein